MSKIICDICGTTYQDTADCCPICGCTRDEALLLGDDLGIDRENGDSRGRGGRFAPKKKKEIFDFDEVNGDLDTHVKGEENPYEEDDYQQPPRHNTFAVVVLTLLIAVLLMAAAFLFIRYYLPGSSEAPMVPSTMAPTEAVQTEPQPVSFPCQTLTLSSGTAELTGEGSFFLIHAIPFPENTTDPIIYQSADTSIATVDESGKVTAVSEGKTVIYITCGTQQITCDVECKFAEETEPPTEETTVATEATEAETVPETTAETVSGLKDVTLKLKQSDFVLPIGTYHTLKLDCDLDPSEVEWSSEHPYIATVDEKGVVRWKASGVTEIYVKYGEQVVGCIVRCE